METVLDIREIEQILPHRYPFLMVDRIVELEDGARIVGIKNVTCSEPYFQGHFPGRPVMPGVMVFEAMAQVGAILAHRSTDGVTPGKTIMLAGADNVRWKRQIIPGDTLRIELTTTKKKRPFWMMDGSVSVDGKVVMSASVLAAEVD